MVKKIFCVIVGMMALGVLADNVWHTNARKSPEWFTKGVICQIQPRAFTPEGTLKAAEAKLPYLKDLGVTIAYLVPVFRMDDDMDRSFWSPRQIRSGFDNPKNQYRIADYFHVDEEYGTDQDLKDFCAAAHKLGMKVLFDLVYLHCGLRTRIGVIAMLLAVYAAVLLWCASPLVPSGTDPMSLEGCFMGYLDRFLTPGTLNEKGVFAPSGVPMSAVSVGTALLGMCAGDVVRAARWDGPRKTAVLLGLGVALLAIGLAVSTVIPINKKLWSPSYTLVVGGASFALFAAFYWLIDVRGWRSWALPLRWVGTNAIAMYFAHALLPFDEIARRLVGFAAGLFPEPSLVITLGDLALTLLMARFLYRQKVFFKV